MLDRIREIWREAKEPLAALWRYGKGHWTRWRALKKFAKKQGLSARKDREKLERHVKTANDNIARLRKTAHSTHDRLDKVRKEIEAEEAKPAPDTKKLARLEAQKDDLTEELDRLRDRVDDHIQARKKANREIDDAKKVLAFWIDKRTVYRKEWKQARKRHQQGNAPQFQEWMLGSHPKNITEGLKPIVAWLVVVRHQTITATSDFTHAPGSYHYPQNAPNRDNQCHAIDWAGADMCGAMTALLAKFGQAFLEQFGPCLYYIKNGVRFPGMFPAHGDHGHTAIAN